MITRIALTAGKIWLELDKRGNLDRDGLFKRLESRETSRDLLFMALGWLVYQKHIKWTLGENGGRLQLINFDEGKEAQNEKSNQNPIAAHSA